MMQREEIDGGIKKMPTLISDAYSIEKPEKEILKEKQEKPKKKEKLYKRVFRVLIPFIKMEAFKKSRPELLPRENTAQSSASLIEESIQQTTDYVRLFNEGLHRSISLNIKKEKEIRMATEYINEVAGFFSEIDKDESEITIVVVLIHKMKTSRKICRNIEGIEKCMYSFLTKKNISIKKTSSLYYKHLIGSTLNPSLSFSQLLSVDPDLSSAYINLSSIIENLMVISKTFSSPMNILFCTKILKEIKKEVAEILKGTQNQEKTEFKDWKTSVIDFFK